MIPGSACFSHSTSAPLAVLVVLRASLETTQEGTHARAKDIEVVASFLTHQGGAFQAYLAATDFLLDRSLQLASADRILGMLGMSFKTSANHQEPEPESTNWPNRPAHRLEVSFVAAPERQRDVQVGPLVLPGALLGAVPPEVGVFLLRIIVDRTGTERDTVY